MEHIFISFCEDADYRATSHELLSGTVAIDFNHELLFFCDSPLPEAAEMPHNSTAYICCGLPVIQRIKQILGNWMAHDTKANITKHFRSDTAFKKWRKTVGFSDDELLWQVYIRDDDGGLDVLLSFGPCLPQALQDVFSLAQSLHNS